MGRGLEGLYQWGLEVVRWRENQSNRRFFALEPFYGYIRRYQSRPSWKRTWNSLMGVDAVNFCAGGGWILSLIWTYRCRWCGSGDSFHESIGCIRYLHIWGRWKLPNGEERGRVSCLLSTHGISWRNGLEPEARRLPDVKLILFVSCMQTREHFHAVTSLWHISFYFWWVSLGCFEGWAWIYGALSQVAGGQPCWGRMMINRHEDEGKSILFALDPLCVCVRSYV